MTVECIPLEKTNAFSGLFLDYLSGKPELSSFYHRRPVLDSIAAQIEEKGQHFSQAQRNTLVSVLQAQYDGLEVTEAVKTNINALAGGKTFTVTTGHQLNVLTGPLYFIFKIATVVDAARILAEKHPGYTFVPVYWMASEDHDLAEINHANLFGRTHTWETEQTGPVGRMSTEGLDKMMAGIQEKLPVFEKAYTKFDTLAEAVRCYVNELFGEHGVVVVDADQHELKQALIPAIKDDVLNHHANDLAEEASKKLGELGYKTQIFPRKINFFYLQPGQRNRIVREGDAWQVLNTETKFTEEELLAEIEAKPENFSPNVVLRPLYQELILPNLAYVGGPAEAAYWLQLKGVFDHFQVPLPLIMPRNFGLILNKRTSERIESLGLTTTDFFRDEQELVKEYVASHTQAELSLLDERNRIQEVFTQIKDKATQVDPTLEGRIGAHLSEVLKNVDKLEKRLEKAEREKHDKSVKHIQSVKARMFPNGSLQERHDNFLNFILPNPELITQLVEGFDAFNYQMYVFKE
ncbi:MAG TPA: bacillithiol biosynthesis cysteine-adding enzyme BshC [Cytophagales bacterium]|nr:bacillithiol biosynthesis cysteine-adding enzyme BshC [Cytophagales bacterium]HAA24390.1 bacillithiol biosynthesis cysteine-adding enzyme BshC [Cytophagales bacterium]HAP59517.1 bacillithiol biosynthesis cysteine-adding enzyme BshC [Cytophagales bacterium]